MKTIEFKVAGVSFRAKDNEAVRKLTPEGTVELRHNPFVHPTNPAYNDQNAVEVWNKGHLIGYLSKGSNERTAFFELKSTGADVKAVVKDFSYAHYDANLRIIDGSFNDELSGYLASVTIEMQGGVTNTHYTIDGKDYVRTTKISGMIDEIGFTTPDFLYKWMTETGGERIDYAGYLAKLEKVRAEGDLIHAANEEYVKNGIVIDGLPHGTPQFVEKFQVEHISSEQLIVDKKIKVAGRYDLFAEANLKFSKGKRGNVVIDWKRGSQLKIGYMLQCAFYSKKLKADEFWVVLFGTNNKCGYSVKAFNKNDINKLYIVFASLAMCFHWLCAFNQFKLGKK